MHGLKAIRSDYFTTHCISTTAIKCIAALTLITALVVGILALMEHGSFALLSNPGLCGGGCLAIAGLVGICLLICLAGRKNKNITGVSVDLLEHPKDECIEGIKRFLNTRDAELHREVSFQGTTKEYDKSLIKKDLVQFSDHATYLQTSDGWVVNIPVKTENSKNILILLAYHDKKNTFWSILLKRTNEIVKLSNVGYLLYSGETGKKENKTQEEQIRLVRNILEGEKCTYTSPLDGKKWKIELFTA